MQRPCAGLRTADTGSAAAYGAGLGWYLRAVRRFLLIALVLGLLAGAGGSGLASPGPSGVGTRIVGSPTNAVQSEWPFTTLVRPPGSLCGGSVVSSRWVLTAAHCMFDESDTLFPSFALYPGAFDRLALPPGQIADATRVHPNYTGDASAWDFALLRLPRPATAPAVSMPAPADDAAIAAARAATPAGARNGRIAGWGSMGTGGAGPFPEILQSIAGGIPLLVDSQCAAYGILFEPASMVCAGGFPTIGTSDDTCQGDSGGPLVADVNGRRVLIGVTSFGGDPFGTGDPCGDPTYPGVYAKVQAARDWICDTVTSPAAITATGGRNSVTVTWSPDTAPCPWRDPQVRVTLSPGGATATAALSAGSVTFTALPRATAYSVTAAVVSSSGAQPPAATATTTTSSLPDPCTQTFYQQDARTARSATAPDGTPAVRVVSRLRIYEDAESWCRTSLTFIFRDTRTLKRLAQLPGSTLGFRKLTGKDFSAPVVSWPTTREFRFAGSDSTGLGRKDARLVLVSFLTRTRLPAQSNIELVVVRRIPTNPAAPEATTNPLFAQKNTFGTAVGWATVS